MELSESFSGGWGGMQIKVLVALGKVLVDSSQQTAAQWALDEQDGIQYLAWEGVAF